MKILAQIDTSRPYTRQGSSDLLTTPEPAVTLIGLATPRIASVTFRLSGRTLDHVDLFAGFLSDAGGLRTHFGRCLIGYF